LSSSYDQDVRDRFAAAGEDVSGYGDIGDGWVDIDSAEGSDQDPDFTGTRLVNLNINNRFYISHETYGDHSGMRKHPDSDNYAAGILAGNYDM
jgi:hypothetical protein